VHVGDRTRSVRLPAVLAGLVAAPLHGFATPDANIHCTYLPKAENLVCSMRSAHYGTTMNEDCRSRTAYQWQGWQLYRHRKTVPICAPNTLWRGQPAYTTLDYGRAWKRGIFACVSQRRSLTCRTSTGHGLYVAFDSWRAW
jgi:hypothetical protein